MAVDRGELRYPIVVEDRFSRPIRAFRRELLLAQGTINQVRQSISGFQGIGNAFNSAARGAQNLGRESAQAGRATAQAAQQQTRRLREIQQQQRVQQSNERLRANILREERRAQANTEAAAKRAATAQTRATKEATAAAARRKKEFTDLASQLGRSESSASRLAFTFRRLFGVLAAFTVARQAIGGFASLIGSAITFNKQVEDSTVGLAQLFVSVGQVRDQFGNLATGADAFRIATSQAREQIGKLRADSLVTTATFEELLFAFQVATGPGLQAGLKLDEIRQATVLISQAASALGLEQDKLAEEIRSVLRGQIQGRTTLLASFFGDPATANREIKQAITTGKTLDFLRQKLGPVGLAAELTQQNFSGLLQRLREGASFAGGRAATVFFEELKGLVGDLGSAFLQVKRDANGIIQAVTPSPAAVKTLAILFDGLQRAVSAVRVGLGTLDLSQVQNATALVADAIAGLAEVAVAFVRGLISGLSDVARIVKTLFAGVDTGLLKEAVALFGRVAVLAGVFSLALSGAAGALRLVFSPITIIIGLMTKVAGLATTIVGVFRFLPSAVALGIPIVGALAAGFLVAQQHANDLEKAVDNINTALERESTLNQIGAQLNSTRRELEALEKRQVISPAAVERIELLKQRMATLTQQARDTNKALSLTPEQAKANIFPDVLKQLEQQQSAASFSLKGIITEFNADISTLLAGSVNQDIVDEEGILKKVDDLVAKINEKFQAQGEVAPKEKNPIGERFAQLAAENAKFLETAVKGVQEFSAFAADAVVGAFDPSQDASLRERFAQFLQGLAKMVLQQIFTLIIATAIAKAFGVPLPGDSTPPPAIPGLAEGGTVPDGSSAVPFARPAGVAASDTQPAWLTPGEVVERVAAVRKYGEDFMLGLNEGLYDPVALREAAGVSRARRSRGKEGRVGFATGGVVGASQRGRTVTSEAGASPSAGSGPTPAFIVPSNQAAERFLGGGVRGMLSVMRQNRAAFRSELGIRG